MRNKLRIFTCALAVLVAVQVSTALADSKNELSDTWLQAKLVTTYTLNPHLSVFDIDTDVTNGQAILTGAVESDVEKDLAGEIAESISGIKSVRNNIKVEPNQRAENKKADSDSDRSFGQVVDDLSISASIKSKLIANQNVEGFDVEVDTMNGVVTLNGTVEAENKKALIEQIAENTGGVTKVVNQLKLVKNKA